jgi:hypothetical protein
VANEQDINNGEGRSIKMTDRCISGNKGVKVPLNFGKILGLLEVNLVSKPGDLKKILFSKLEPASGGSIRDEIREGG